MHRDKDWKHDAKKLTEELLELATELVKQHNKPHKYYHDKIQDELADVAYRMDRMIEWYSTEAIAQRVVDKWGDG
jgi:NTP pyrophosphatase (non-canonical NTP hydrolase)